MLFGLRQPFSFGRSTFRVMPTPGTGSERLELKGGCFLAKRFPCRKSTVAGWFSKALSGVIRNPACTFRTFSISSGPFNWVRLRMPTTLDAGQGQALGNESQRRESLRYLTVLQRPDLDEL
jgi:hypothetical protein